MGHPINRRCLKTIFFLLRQIFKTTDFCSGGLDLQYRTPEMDYPSREIEKDNFGVSQGTPIRARNKEAFEFKVLKKNNIVLQLPLPSWSRKVPTLIFIADDQPPCTSKMIKLETDNTLALLLR